MSEINVEAVTVEATPEENVTVEKKEVKPEKAEKKTRKPRAPKARKVEELIEEATKKMTEKEKDLLIEYLRTDTGKLKQQIEELNHTIESAFKQVQLVQEQYNAMEKYYQDSLQYIDGQVTAFANAVRKSTVGGTH